MSFKFPLVWWIRTSYCSLNANGKKQCFWMCVCVVLFFFYLKQNISIKGPTWFPEQHLEKKKKNYMTRIHQFTGKCQNPRCLNWSNVDFIIKLLARRNRLQQSDLIRVLFFQEWFLWDVNVGNVLWGFTICGWEYRSVVLRHALGATRINKNGLHEEVKRHHQSSSSFYLPPMVGLWETGETRQLFEQHTHTPSFSQI